MTIVDPGAETPAEAAPWTVPDVEPDAVVDPHWLELRSGGLLPSAYMPPTMPRNHGIAWRGMSAFLIGVFLLATTLGVCLTYGPP